METNEKKKQKYKKHKEGFKIAVDYKVNDSLKSYQDIYGSNLYPLYVEVRAKGQRSYFKSCYNFYINPLDLDAFVNHELINTILLKEKEFITSHLDSYYEYMKDRFSIKDWLGAYRMEESRASFDQSFMNYCRKILLGFTKDIPVINAIDSLTLGEEFLDSTLNLAIILRELGVQKCDELISSILAHKRVSQFFHRYSEEWLYPEIKAVIHLSLSPSIDVLFFQDLFKKKPNVVPKKEVKSFLSDIEALMVAVQG